MELHARRRLTGVEEFRRIFWLLISWLSCSGRRAQQGHLRRFEKPGGRLVVQGIADGVARTFRTLLFEIEPVDARSLLAGGILLMAVTAAAALGPARRASRVDPIVVLRAD